MFSSANYTYHMAMHDVWYGVCMMYGMMYGMMYDVVYYIAIYDNGSENFVMCDMIDRFVHNCNISLSALLCL